MSGLFAYCNGAGVGLIDLLFKAQPHIPRVNRRNARSFMCAVHRWLMAANWPSPGATWMDSWRGDAKVRKWASWLRSLHAQEGIILLQKAVGTIPTHLFAKVLHQCTVLQLCWHTVASCDICHHFFQAKRSQHVLYRYTMNMRAQFVYISSLVICGHGSGTLSSPTPVSYTHLTLPTKRIV